MEQTRSRIRNERGDFSLLDALAKELPDVFLSEVVRHLDFNGTLALAQVSTWYRDAVWSVHGARSFKTKFRAHEKSIGKHLPSALHCAVAYGKLTVVRALVATKKGLDVGYWTLEINDEWDIDGYQRLNSSSDPGWSIPELDRRRHPRWSSQCN